MSMQRAYSGSQGLLSETLWPSLHPCLAHHLKIHHAFHGELVWWFHLRRSWRSASPMHSKWKGRKSLNNLIARDNRPAFSFAESQGATKGVLNIRGLILQGNTCRANAQETPKERHFLWLSDIGRGACWNRSNLVISCAGGENNRSRCCGS